MIQRILLLLALVTSITMAGCDASEPDSNPGSITEISGIWDTYWEDETDTYEYFTFEQTGSSLAGTWYDEDDELFTISGSFSERVLNVDVDYPDPVEQYHVQGSISDDGNTITGTVTVKLTGEAEEVYQLHLVRRS